MPENFAPHSPHTAEIRSVSDLLVWTTGATTRPGHPFDNLCTVCVIILHNPSTEIDKPRWFQHLVSASWGGGTSVLGLYSGNLSNHSWDGRWKGSATNQHRGWGEHRLDADHYESKKTGTNETTPNAPSWTAWDSQGYYVSHPRIKDKAQYLGAPPPDLVAAPVDLAGSEQTSYTGGLTHALD